MEPLTPAWDLQQWGRMDRSSRRWAASAQMGVQGWAAQLLDSVLYSTNRTLGQTLKQINLTQVMTFGDGAQFRKSLSDAEVNRLIWP